MMRQDGYCNQQPPRQKRVRTSFKHHQLRTMKSYFNLNHNPDAKDLKQLSQKTGLSKRVLQVYIFFIYNWKKCWMTQCSVRKPAFNFKKKSLTYFIEKKILERSRKYFIWLYSFQQLMFGRIKKKTNRFFKSPQEIFWFLFRAVKKKRSGTRGKHSPCSILIDA